VQKEFVGNTPPGVKPFLHDVVIQEISQSEQAHALMVGHPTAYNLGTAVPEFTFRGREVSCFVEAVAPEPSQVSHPVQISYRSHRICNQHEKCRIKRDQNRVCFSSPQRQMGKTKSIVL
jgi:hypothetical protein